MRVTEGFNGMRVHSMEDPGEFGEFALTPALDL